MQFQIALFPIILCLYMRMGYTRSEGIMGFTINVARRHIIFMKKFEYWFCIRTVHNFIKMPHPPAASSLEKIKKWLLNCFIFLMCTIWYGNIFGLLARWRIFDMYIKIIYSANILCERTRVLHATMTRALARDIYYLGIFYVVHLKRELLLYYYYLCMYI